MFRWAKLFAMLCALYSCAAYAQVGAISGQVISTLGTPLPNALVRVCNAATATGTPCDPTTPIFMDFGLSQPAPNPYLADQYGNYTFYVPSLAAPNLYTVQYSPNSGITWAEVKNGPVNGAPAVQACNQLGSTAAAQINAAALKIPNGGLIDASCYGSDQQIIDQQITALSLPGRPIQLQLNQATPYSITATFSGALISQSVASGVSGASGACVVPIGAGSSISTPGWNQPGRNQTGAFRYWRLDPTAATYDVFCNAAMDGTQESVRINGLGIIGDPKATMSGSLLHLRKLFVSTVIENVVTYQPYGNAVTVDGGSDQVFRDDNFNDSAPSGEYVGAVLTLNCPSNVSFYGGAIQFNGIHNPLIVGRGFVPGLNSCPLSTTLNGTRFYGTDIELQAATVGTFPGAATNVDPIQLTDVSNMILDNMNVAGNIGAGQHHLVDIFSSGNNGQVRGPVEIDNIWYIGYTTWVANGNGSLIHNAVGAPYVSPQQADVFGKQNGSTIGVGRYRWAGAGAAQASVTDYEDTKDFTSVAAGTVNTVVDAARQPGVDIGVQVNNALASCSQQCTVYVPAGSYTYTTTIQLPLITLGAYELWLDQGAKLQYNGSAEAVLAPVSGSPNATNFRIHGGAIYGTSAATAGVHILPTNAASIKDMLIFGFTGGPGLWLDGPNGVTVFDNMIQGNQTGVLLSPTYCNGSTCGTGVTGSAFTPNQIWIGSNRITNNLQWGIQSTDPVTSMLSGALNDVIDSNDLEINGRSGSQYGAVNFGRSHGLIITGNYFEGSPRQIVLGIPGGGDGNQFRFFSSQGPQIINNYFTDVLATPFDIELLDTTDARIEGNTTDEVSRNSSNCFVDTLANNGTNIGETGTYFGKNHVENYTTGGNTFCIGGTGVSALVGAGSFALFNLNLAMQVVGGGNYTITSSGTSETVSIPGLTLGSVCGVYPSPNVPGGAATAIASTLTSTGTPGILTMTHPSGVAGVHVAFACNSAIN